MDKPHRWKTLINRNQPSTAEILYGASGKLVGIGSSFPSASALARTYIWLDIAPADSRALATTSQLWISVDVWSWFKSEETIASQPTYSWRRNPSMDRTYEMRPSPLVPQLIGMSRVANLVIRYMPDIQLFLSNQARMDQHLNTFRWHVSWSSGVLPTPLARTKPRPSSTPRNRRWSAAGGRRKPACKAEAHLSLDQGTGR